MRTNTPRAAACVRATKNPARSPARASRRSFGEYAFLEDSRYASQAQNVRRKRGVIIVLSQLGFCPSSALSGPQSYKSASPPCAAGQAGRGGTTGDNGAK